MFGRAATWTDVEDAAREALELRVERNRYRECAKELRTAVKALEHRICTGRGTMLDCLPVTEPALARSHWLDDEATP
jgi:hypothetical protein